MANRASIKPFLLPYCEQVGQAIGTDDISEIIAVIVLDHKRGKCSCSADTQPAAAPIPSTTESDLLSELENLPGLAK